VNSESGPPAQKSSRAYFKNLGHIQAYQDVPDHLSILTHGRQALMALNDNKKDLLAALELSNKRFVIVSTQEEQGSSVWFYLVQQGIRHQFHFEGYYTSDSLTIQSMIQHGADPKKNKSKVIQQQNQAIVQNIVDSSAPIEWFRSVIKLCINLKASDVHLEIRQGKAQLRIRRDGLMRDVKVYEEELVTSALSAVYTLLAEERSRSEVAFNLNASQSALIPLTIQQNRYGLRYQSHPAVNGYDVIFRILKTEVRSNASQELALEKLGFTPWQSKSLQDALSTANGGIFVAGITGSGKTTTLSALLHQLSSAGDRKIISIEDPVEYQVPGVSHLSVQRAAGHEHTEGSNPFASAMMAFLRMDPDVGMFGEIRDNLSAQIAYTAIQTGHKLLTTVHATSALGIISRLTSPQIGLIRADICRPEFISALVYQSLIPRTCEHCKLPAESIMKTSDLQIYETHFYLDTKRMFVASDDGCSECKPADLATIRGGHAGVNGVSVAAEIIQPDLRMLEFLSKGEDMKAFNHWRNLQTSSFSHPDMLGKPAWAHALYEVSQGHIDPYHFEKVFGSPLLLKINMDDHHHG
jgi:type II secretory ATPase GspE/PulE/Tfp pilus assembly ATPase PilB-like protein